MNSMIKNALLFAALFGAPSIGIQSANAQEVALVYASHVMTTNSLSNINSTLTPELLAKEFSKELTAELNERLPQEQADLRATSRIRNDYAVSIRTELDVRLIEEIRGLVATSR